MERLDGIEWGVGPVGDVLLRRAAERRRALERLREGELVRVTDAVTALVMVGEWDAARRLALKEGYELMDDGSVEVGF